MRNELTQNCATAPDTRYLSTKSSFQIMFVSWLYLLTCHISNDHFMLLLRNLLFQLSMRNATLVTLNTWLTWYTSVVTRSTCW